MNTSQRADLLSHTNHLQTSEQDDSFLLPGRIWSLAMVYKTPVPEASALTIALILDAFMSVLCIAMSLLQPQGNCYL